MMEKEKEFADKISNIRGQVISNKALWEIKE